MAIHNGYVGAKTCTQGPATGARGVMAWFLAKYADDGGLNAGIYNCRPIRGSTRTTSLHGEGRAVDLAIRPYSAAYGTKLADLIRRHSAELGIQCVIWNRRIWSGYYDDWRTYTGVNRHVDHLHVELTWAAANRSAAATVALWEKVLGDLVDDDTAVKPVGNVKPSAPAKSKAKAWPHANLLADGDFGKVSVKALQELLAGIDLYDGRIDGDFGKLMKRAAQKWLKNNGHYSGRIDGDFGALSVKALQSFLVSKGELPNKAYIDGSFGNVTVKALQRYLNSQAKHYK